VDTEEREIGERERQTGKKRKKAKRSEDDEAKGGG
jgi:hypothetical protein